MRKIGFAKNLALLLGLLLPLLLLTGCLQQGAQFGAPGGVSIQGKVAVPDADCVVSSCTNPQVSSGSEPAPEVKVSLMGENGNNLVTYTNQCGEYEVSGAQDSCYILYAKVKENMWVKQGIIPEGSNYNAGEANAYTTAQVIIYEVAKQLYPGQVKCSDIPGFVPTPELVEAVENALRECRDAQQDATVAQLASSIVRNLFGAVAENEGGSFEWMVEAVTSANEGQQPGGGNDGGGTMTVDDTDSEDEDDVADNEETGDSDEGVEGNTYNHITNNYYDTQDIDGGGGGQHSGNGCNGPANVCGPGNGNGNRPNPGNGNGNLNGGGPGTGNNGQNNGWGNGNEHGHGHGHGGQ